jgi:glutathione synthase/RimK-type ligase-like ATP-grasp enzyme
MINETYMKNILILKSVISESDKELEEHLNSLDTKLSFRTITYDDLVIKIDQGKINIYDLNFNTIIADVIYFRLWERNFEIATTVANFAKQEGIPFHDSYVGSIRNGLKLLQMSLFAINGINVPKTIFISNKYIKKNYEYLSRELGSQFVIKSTDGRKGKDNYLVKNKKELNLIKLKTTDKYIMQEFIPNSFDFRYLVLGEKVGIAYKRIRSNKNDYRNNVAKGARIEYVDKNEYLYSDIAIKAAKLMSCEVCGVDIVISDSDKKPYVFEANNGPGVYSTDDISDWSRVDALHSFFKSMF